MTTQSLNDDFRKNPLGVELRITPGVQALSDDDIKSLINLVRDYNNFDEGNDPYGEHDFGAIEFKGVGYFWKIDYYDLNYKYGSEDPSNPNITKRVLILMEASEY